MAGDLLQMLLAPPSAPDEQTQVPLRPKDQQAPPPAPNISAPINSRQAPSLSPQISDKLDLKTPSPSRKPDIGTPMQRPDYKGAPIPGTQHIDPETGEYKTMPYSYAQQLNPTLGAFAHAQNIMNPGMRTFSRIAQGLLGTVSNIADTFEPGAREERAKELAAGQKYDKDQAEGNLDTQTKEATLAHTQAETKKLEEPTKLSPSEQEAQGKLGASKRLGEIEQLEQQPDLPPAQKAALENEKKQIFAGQPTLVPPTREAGQEPNAQGAAEYHAQLAQITPHLSAGERSAYEFPAGYTPTGPEISAMAKSAHQAEQTALSGKREDRAAATAAAVANKKTLEDKAIEGIAQSIAPMDIKDLTRLKDITSMRSDQRELIYERAKEINPAFNTSEVDRRVKMLDQFTNGKDGQNLQSFGTFLEHAGEANRVVQDVRSNLPPKALNTAINKLTDAGWGTSKAQITAALEPVRTEFEKFLSGGMALHKEDIEAGRVILSDSSTPAQVQTALKQMGHTVQARYGEMGDRFKKNMGVSMEDGLGPASQEAHDGAAAIGLTRLGDYELKTGDQGYGWYKVGSK
jgi:hypothetical protein